jgi:hypothetical protein
MGSGAKSYMRKGYLIYEEISKYFTIYMRRLLVIYCMTLNPIPLNFLYFLFYQCTCEIFF